MNGLAKYDDAFADACLLAPVLALSAAEVIDLESWITLALPGAVAYAASLLGHRAQGEDIVQDCLCRLLSSGARYDLAQDGRKLLFKSITNACLNHKSRSHESFSLDDLGRSDEGGGWEIEDQSALEPLDLVIAEEVRFAITAGLQTLPIRQRSVLELSSFGYRSVEIAEMLEIPPEHVRVILMRARKAMLAYLNARFLGGITP